MSVSDKIRHHMANYPVGQKFTVEQVGKELNLRTMNGRHYIFAALLEKGFIRQLSSFKRGHIHHWVYKKIVDFSIEDTKAKRIQQDGPMIALEDMDTFIFGGNAERIVGNLHFKTNGRV